MATLMPEQPAPTPGEVMNALRIRDEIASLIRRSDLTLPIEKARTAAERLIAAGFVDTAAVHRSIIDGDDDDALDDL